MSAVHMRRRVRAGGDSSGAGLDLRALARPPGRHQAQQVHERTLVQQSRPSAGDPAGAARAVQRRHGSHGRRNRL